MVSWRGKRIRHGVIAEVAVALLLLLCALAVLLRGSGHDNPVSIGDQPTDSAYSVRPDSVAPAPPRRHKKKSGPARTKRPGRNPLDEHVPQNESEL